jgi:hypothetical protein
LMTPNAATASFANFLSLFIGGGTLSTAFKN